MAVLRTFASVRHAVSSSVRANSNCAWPPLALVFSLQQWNRYLVYCLIARLRGTGCPAVLLHAHSFRLLRWIATGSDGLRRGGAYWALALNPRIMLYLRFPQAHRLAAPLHIENHLLSQLRNRLALARRANDDSYGRCD
jgi:hypothetical protein